VKCFSSTHKYWDVEGIQKALRSTLASVNDYVRIWLTQCEYTMRSIAWEDGKESLFDVVA
jgi:hypothetical protein